MFDIVERPAMISFQCEGGAKYQAKDASAGTLFPCKKCGAEIAVPALEPSVEQDADGGEDLLPVLPTQAKPPKKKLVEI